MLDEGSEVDDTLTLLFLCCHPSLSPPSQLALTLRAVGGLTTAEIAAAFLVPEATMAQRISRAKARVRDEHFTASLERLDVVLHVLYLLFNEGYTASSGAALARVELSREAIRLVRMLRRLLPDDDEVAGLLALMLLTDARRPARLGRPARAAGLSRTARSGTRTRSPRALALIASVLASGPSARTSCRRRSPPSTPRRRGRRTPTGRRSSRSTTSCSALGPNPMVSLNRAVAVGMVSRPGGGPRRARGASTSAWPTTTACTRSAPTCWLDLGDTRRPPARPSSPRPPCTTSAPERAYLESRAVVFNLKA